MGDQTTNPLTEVAKLAPTVYSDGFQPSVKEIGGTLHGVVRTLLTPINALVWTADQAGEWLKVYVSEILRKRAVAQEALIAPKPQVLFGVIRGVQATGAEEDTHLREMYATLLATAMDCNTASNAHPAFADLLMQMLPDEARVICLLEQRGGDALVSLALDAWSKDDRPMSRFEREIESLAGEAECLKSSAIESYLDNLKRLGLIQEQALRWERLRTEFPPSTSSRIGAELLGVMGYDFPPVASAIKEFCEFREKGVPSWVINARMIHLTAFGEQFVEACVTKDGSRSR